jgi:hypothetical protein
MANTESVAMIEPPQKEVFVTSRLISGFSMKRECIKHTYEAYKTMILVEISYYNFDLGFTWK